MRYYFPKSKWIPILGMSFFFFSYLSVQADVNVNLNVEGCNNNNICESNLGETTINCSNDCTLCNSNNVCEVLKGESTASCPLDCPAPVIPPASQSVSGSRGSSVARISIVNVKVVPGIYSAVISWDTYVPTFGMVQWGESIDYAAGSVDKIGISSAHRVTLEDLLPGKTYFFQIVASLPVVKSGIYTGTFTMPLGEDLMPPANVSHLSGKVDGEEVILSWQNPGDADLAGIKILRSPYFFPKNMDDGKVIYDGLGTYARDTNVDLNKVFYYTVYSYDRNKNYSSGALIQMSRSLPIVGGTTLGVEEQIKLDSFSFTQNNIRLPIKNNVVKMYPFYDTDISIFKDKVPESVQSIILNITDAFSPANSFQYRLALSKDKKMFTVRMGLINESGIYPFSFKLIGYDNKSIGEIYGKMDVNSVNAGLIWGIGWLYVVLSILLMILIVIVGAMRRRTNNR